MDAGKLRHRIKIIDQPREPRRNQFGEEIEQDLPVVTVWASIEPISGREYFAAQQVSAETTHRVRMRYHVGIRPQQMIEHDTRKFSIVSVVDVGERKKELEVMATEVMS